MLRALARANSSAQRAMISHANKDLILALVECATNIIRGNVELSDSQYNKLKRYHSQLKRLIRKKTSQKERKTILQRGGFLGALVGPLLKVLLG